VQADAATRLRSEDIGKVYVRSKTTNEMIPLSTLVTIRNIAGTELTNRFNLLRSVEVQGRPLPASPPGSLAALEQVFAETMPKEMGFAYSSISYQKKSPRRPHRPSSWPSSAFSSCWPPCMRAGGYPGGPPGIAAGGPGRVLRHLADGYDNNVYVQIGLVMLIGLAAKNAI